MGLLHEQHESGDSTVLFRCTECDYTSLSLGQLHAHAEKHRGWFGLQLPWRVGDFDALMEYTEVLRVESASEIPLTQVNDL